MNKNPTNRRRNVLSVAAPQSLIGSILPVSGKVYEITVERKKGDERYTAMDLEWKSDRRISFMDLATKRQTTISADYIKVVEVPAQ
jgi:hypothetical protein